MATFGLGASERHIGTLDADGVALAAIQGLYDVMKAEIEHRDARIEALENRLADLERLIRESIHPGRPLGEESTTDSDGARADPRPEVR